MATYFTKTILENKKREKLFEMSKTSIIYLSSTDTASKMNISGYIFRVWSITS